MTEQGMPETIVEIKKWLQKHVSKNARRIDRNNDVLRYNSGESTWKPRGRGLCNWLTMSTDAKRHVLIWTIDGNDYMKAEARKLADQCEAAIKEQLNQIVPIEFKDAPQYTCNLVVPSGQPERVTVTHVGLCGIRTEAVPDDDDWF